MVPFTIVIPQYFLTRIGSTNTAVRTTAATVEGAVYRTDRHASVNIRLSQPANVQHGRPRRREKKLFVHSSKPEAEVTDNRRLSTYIGCR